MIQFKRHLLTLTLLLLLSLPSFAEDNVQWGDAPATSGPVGQTNNLDAKNNLEDPYNKLWNDLNMVLIRGGCFQGSGPSRENRDGNEKQHQVCVDDFYMGKYEVTSEQYAQCVKAGHCNLPETGERCIYWRSGYQNHPINCVSWHDAQAFSNWFSEETGKNFRLPTEAEWEYAARAGSTTAFYWGEDIFYRQICAYANVHDKTSKQVNGFAWASAECEDGYAQTAPVGSFKPNAWGLFDMSGNLWEWTCSGYDQNYLGSEENCDSNGIGDGSRVKRGGSWLHVPKNAHSNYRSGYVETEADYYLGFRLSASP